MYCEVCWIKIEKKRGWDERLIYTRRIAKKTAIAFFNHVDCLLSRNEMFSWTMTMTAEQLGCVMILKLLFWLGGEMSIGIAIGIYNFLGRYLPRHFKTFQKEVNWVLSYTAYNSHMLPNTSNIFNITRLFSIVIQSANRVNAKTFAFFIRAIRNLTIFSIQPRSNHSLWASRGSMVTLSEDGPKLTN